jgi:AcrR family transcriptional regulator
VAFEVLLSNSTQFSGFSTLSAMARGESTALEETPTRASEYRARLLEGMAAAVEEKGFAETTIADIARHARVSKRTFYEQFATKQDCLLALYVTSSEGALATIAGSIDPTLGLDAQIAKTAEVYYARMQERPTLLRTLLVEILAAGPKGLEVRREVNRRYAQLLRESVASVRTKGRERYSLSEPMAIAVVGGLNELLLLAVEEGRLDRLGEIAGPAAELMRSVVRRS